MSLRALIEQFCVSQEARGLAERTVVTYRQRLQTVVRLLDARACSGIPTAEDLDAVLLAMRAQGRSCNGIRNVRVTLALFGRWLHERGQVPRNPAGDLRVGAVPDDVLPRPPLSEAEVAELIDAIPRDQVIDLRNRVHVGLMYSCGLRLSESLALTTGDVNLDQQILTVHGKGGHQRQLPILDPEADALADYLAVRRSLLRGPDLGWLFLGRWGRPLRIPSFTCWLSAHSTMALGKPVNPHLLRHSVAVHLLRGGADIRHVQVFLGHADIDVTKVYLRMLPGQLRHDYNTAMPWIGR